MCFGLLLPAETPTETPLFRAQSPYSMPTLTLPKHPKQGAVSAGATTRNTRNNTLGGVSGVSAAKPRRNRRLSAQSAYLGGIQIHHVPSGNSLPSNASLSYP